MELGPRAVGFPAWLWKCPRGREKHAVLSSGVVLEDHGHDLVCLLCARCFTGDISFHVNSSPVQSLGKCFSYFLMTEGKCAPKATWEEELLSVPGSSVQSVRVGTPLWWEHEQSSLSLRICSLRTERQRWCSVHFLHFIHPRSSTAFRDRTSHLNLLQKLPHKSSNLSPR